MSAKPKKTLKEMLDEAEARLKKWEAFGRLGACWIRRGHSVARPQSAGRGRGVSAQKTVCRVCKCSTPAPGLKACRDCLQAEAARYRANYRRKVLARSGKGVIR